MKKVGITMMLILGIGIQGFAQSEEKEEYRLKLKKVEDGVVTDIDTVFTSLEAYEEFLKSMDMEVPDLKERNLDITEVKPGDGQRIRVIKNVDVEVDGNGDTIYKSIDISADTFSWNGEDGERLIIERIEETEDEIVEDGEVKVERRVMILREIKLEELTEKEAKKIGEKASKQLEIEQFKVYPNPSQGQVSVEVEGLEGKEVELSLKDVNGRDIQVEHFMEMKKTHVLMLEDLAPGTYYLVLKSEGASFMRKLIVL